MLFEEIILAANSTVEALFFPDCARVAKQLIDFMSCIALDRVHQFSDWNQLLIWIEEHAAKEMNVCGHYDEGVQLRTPSVLEFAGVEDHVLAIVRELPAVSR